VTGLALETYQLEEPIAAREWGDERLAIVVQKLMATKPDMAPPTPAEVDLFAMRCRATGLDPFSGQIHAIYRKDKNNPLGRSLTFQTGIDGLWLIASRTGLLDGMDPPEWLDGDGTWRDAWPYEYPPLAARVKVYRQGASRPFVGVAMYAEYVQSYDGRPQGLWSRMPANQLRKCAAAQALREAFANDLGDVYEDAELDHADATVPAEVQAARAAEADERTGELRIGPDDVEALTELARRARLTRGEGRGILEDVAGVGNPAHVRRRDLAAVRAAFEAKIPKDAAPVGSAANVGTPEVLAAGEAVDDGEIVETEASPDRGADPAPDRGEQAPASAPKRRRTPKAKPADASAAAPEPLPGQTRNLDDDPLPPPDNDAPADESPTAGPTDEALEAAAPLDTPDDPYAAAMYGPGAP
jgi:phage recombination protein Bet